MNKNAFERLNDLIKEKNSRICAGLDPVWKDIPKSFKKKVVNKILGKDGLCTEENFLEYTEKYFTEIFRQYCISYIDAVADIVPAIKINSAFFEQERLESLYFTIAEKAKEAGLFVIGDVERAGYNSEAYAQAYICKQSPFDAITINAIYGRDGVMPFLKMAKKNGKGVFIIVKTSNKSSAEIQDLELADGKYVYEAIAEKVLDWQVELDKEGLDNGCSMIGSVVGATHHQQAEILRNMMDKTFFLVPGYGAQGATADDVAVNFNYFGLKAIINSSRGIMHAYKKDCWKYQYSEETWEEAARNEAIRATEEVNNAIKRSIEDDF